MILCFEWIYLQRKRLTKIIEMTDRHENLFTLKKNIVILNFHRHEKSNKRFPFCFFGANDIYIYIYIHLYINVNFKNINSDRIKYFIFLKFLCLLIVTDQNTLIFLVLHLNYFLIFSL